MMPPIKWKDIPRLVPENSIWVMASAAKVTEIVEWLEANMVEPRYAVYQTGEAFAVAFTSDDDEVLYAIRWPEFYRRKSER